MLAIPLYLSPYLKRQLNFHHSLFNIVCPCCYWMTSSSTSFHCPFKYLLFSAFFSTHDVAKVAQLPLSYCVLKDEWGANLFQHSVFGSLILPGYPEKSSVASYTVQRPKSFCCHFLLIKNNWLKIPAKNVAASKYQRVHCGHGGGGGVFGWFNPPMSNRPSLMNNSTPRNACTLKTSIIPLNDSSSWEI